MVVCDWSSDVCSSDLIVNGFFNRCRGDMVRFLVFPQGSIRKASDCGARALSRLGLPSGRLSAILTTVNSIVCAPLSNWFHLSPKLLSVTVNQFLSTVLLFKEDRFSVILSFNYGCKVTSLHSKCDCNGDFPGSLVVKTLSFPFKSWSWK